MRKGRNSIKKAYLPPDIVFESFALNESFASGSANCTRTIPNQTDGLCGMYFGNKVVFTVPVAGCRVKIEDGSPVFDGLCYHIPMGDNKLFNS